MEIKIKYRLADLRDKKNGVDQFWLASFLAKNPASLLPTGEEIVEFPISILEEVPESLKNISPVVVYLTDEVANNKIEGGSYGGPEQYDTKAFVTPKSFGIHVEASSKDFESLKTFYKSLLKGDLSPVKKSARKEPWSDESRDSE